LPQPRQNEFDVGSAMIALENAQRLSVKRLDSEADAVNSSRGQDFELRLIQPRGVRFDRKLVPFPQGKPSPDQIEESSQIGGRQMSGRAAAEKESAHFSGVPQIAELALKTPQISADQVIFARDEREVAVAATVQAKRHVKIRSLRIERGQARHTCFQVRDLRLFRRV
jgi:hypothetical protein